MADDEREREQASGEDELKVTDRRLFTADGALRAAVEDESSDSDPDEESPAARQDDERGFERRPVDEPTGVDFTMLINAMAEPALLFLGEIPRPGSEMPSVDLERAQIQIDMLDMLRVKCRGNLTREEEGLLDRILYELRMLYVSRANQPPS